MTASRLGLFALCMGGSVALIAGGKPRVVAGANRILPQAGGITLGAVSASPATISFTATDPDLGSVAGSATSSVRWTTTNGSASRTWDAAVSASTASFTNCGTVPVSAVKVTCTAVS